MKQALFAAAAAVTFSVFSCTAGAIQDLAETTAPQADAGEVARDAGPAATVDPAVDAGPVAPSACLDECTPGQTLNGKTCTLVPLHEGEVASADPSHSLHDRARGYEQWMWRDGLATGYVGNAHYSDAPSYTQLDGMGGLEDSAIWTGTYLAAEAFELEATRAPAARSRVKVLVDKLHTLLAVTGSPGLLARYAKPSATSYPYPMPDFNCADEHTHCGVDWNGTQWDYVGHISRDQYQGMILGYAIAYDALGSDDEATRELIRHDIVTLVKELMQLRTMKLRITINGTTMPANNAQLQFVVINPLEMKNGALELKVDTNNTDDSDMNGFQEFTPDLALLIHAVPGLSWVPSVKRPSSAIMLATIFNLALRMTDGVPAYSADRAAIETFYLSNSSKGGNINDWLDIVKGYSAKLGGCAPHYYGNNITMEPFYNLARLEKDPSRHAIIDDVLENKIWPTFGGTKNSFFNYIYAANADHVDASAVTVANAQLSQFPTAPRIKFPVDLRSDPRYQPHASDCSSQVDHSLAIDVQDRCVTDFLWQRDSWELYSEGDVGQTYPGVDFLVAYWMARSHGFLNEDAADHCYAWK